MNSKLSGTEKDLFWGGGGWWRTQGAGPWPVFEINSSGERVAEAFRGVSLDWGLRLARERVSAEPIRLSRVVAQAKV